MCIRDSNGTRAKTVTTPAAGEVVIEVPRDRDGTFEPVIVCLLYTSDAADERSSVDLGGRRIIKKKNKKQTR